MKVLHDLFIQVFVIIDTQFIVRLIMHHECYYITPSTYGQKKAKKDPKYSKWRTFCGISGQKMRILKIHWIIF